MDVSNFDIQEILEGYRKQSFLPSEVVSAYLDVIQSENPKYNALMPVPTERVMETAKAWDARKNEMSRLPLFGVPVVLKDNFLVDGWKTTAGSKMLENYVAPYTATSVNRLEQAGAIVIAKANMDEFAMGSSSENSAYGVVRNPWDLTRVPGGSSGGSAAAVAAGLAPVALGTDTGGSIRQPASFCGIVGMKPTYGRVSRYGVIAFASSLDQVGPLTRTVWDSARMLEVMAGYHGRDATASRRVVPQFTDQLANVSLKNLKIGVCPDWQVNVDPEVDKALQESIALLKSEGARIVEIDLPNVKYAVSAYYLIAPSEASSNLGRYDGVHVGYSVTDASSGKSLYEANRGEGFGPEVKRRIMLGTYALSAGYYDAFYGRANEIRALIKQDFDGAFDLCDCILSPTAPTTAFGLGEKTKDPLQMYLSDIFTLPANLAGLPGISLPCGSGSNRLPIGLQFIGKPFDESLLFQVGQCFERLRGGFSGTTPREGSR